jgi:hypothetical protein
MRTLVCLLLLLATASFAGESLQDRGGQCLTVRLQGVPAETAVVVCDLTPELRGLPLRQEGGEVWKGCFALLPNMVSGLASPRFHLLDVAGRELDSSSLEVELSSSDFDPSGLATVLSDPQARFVFDNNVDPGSLALVTRDGVAPPEVEGNSFVLPLGVAPLNVYAILARSRSGDTLVFTPDWADNVASVEEELSP